MCCSANVGDRDDRGGRWRVAVPMWAIVMIAVVAGVLQCRCGRS